MLLVAEPSLGMEEKIALTDVVDSGWITMGERVRTFERAFAKWHDLEDAVAVSSCTAGLHLAMRALGIGPGDEVLVPSLTFVATVNCVLYTGATPVFVDIEALDSPILSLADAMAKLTVHTKAVVVMHYAGYLVDRDAWCGFARDNGLLLIEDAAHAAGTAGVGRIGNAAAFSFYGNKNMTTAEGGMVTAPDPQTLDAVRQMRNHGMTSGTLDRLRGKEISYDVTMLGYNYRMDELRAAVGAAQLHHLGAWNERRHMLTRRYQDAIKKRCPEVVLPFPKPGASSYHIMPIVLPANANRPAVIQRLREAGIQTTIHYPPAHAFSFYREHFPFVELPVTEAFASREVTLPLHPNLQEHQVDAVVKALADALAR